MALQRYTRPVDGTIPVPALLYDDEELLASQENTGIYDGYVQAYLSFTHCSKYSSLLDYLVFLTCNPFITSINNSAYRNHQTTRLVQSGTIQATHFGTLGIKRPFKFWYFLVTFT